MVINRESFFDPEGDQRMEKQNVFNWFALAKLIKEADLEGSLPKKDWDVLDVGCHTGGMLEFLDRKRRASSLSGVEPLFNARKAAQKLLPEAQLFETIERVPGQSIDLVVSHEALYLVSDLASWIQELKRILRPEGGAFIALGCHSENTAWLRWRERLAEIYGRQISYIYKPMDILQAGVNAGFDMELHLLHPPQMSFRFCPPEDGWGEFISAEEALGFFRKKYVFVFYPKK